MGLFFCNSPVCITIHLTAHARDLGNILFLSFTHSPQPIHQQVLPASLVQTLTPTPYHVFNFCLHHPQSLQHTGASWLPLCFWAHWVGNSRVLGTNMDKQGLVWALNTHSTLRPRTPHLSRGSVGGGRPGPPKAGVPVVRARKGMPLILSPTLLLNEGTHFSLLHCQHPRPSHQQLVHALTDPSLLSILLPAPRVTL